MVQTGDHARTFVGAPVPLGSPVAVPAPAGGLVGLPRRPVRTFVGRSSVLAQLEGLARARSGVVAQAVHGLGGVGKSEVALQYAARYGGAYSVVWWVPAEDGQLLEAGLAGLTYRLHPDAHLVCTDVEAAGWAVGWLQAHPGWLLVLDNVEDRGLVEPLLGQLTGGHVLITTRRDVGWEEITDGCVRLDVLAPADAVDLLMGLGRTDDRDAAAALCAELGYLPLALQQASAYLRQTRTPIKRYLDRLRASPARTLSAVAAGDAAAQAVTRVRVVTLAAIRRDSPLAERLLQVLAHYAPDDLPRDVLSPLTADPVEVDEALGVLASYNMITLAESTVTVHRLVQAAIIAHLDHRPHGYNPAGSSHPAATDPDGDASTEVVRDAVRLLRSAAPTGNPQVDVAEWPGWAALAPHVTAVGAHSPDQVGGGDLAWLLARLSTFRRLRVPMRAGLDGFPHGWVELGERA